MVDYSTSGVDLGRSAQAKQRIARAAASTHNANVLTGIGHFGGFYALGDSPEDVVLVASTDGVGTKLLLALECGRVDRLGHDLVHHSINDILACGARPLFFLDYMAFGRLDPDMAAIIAESLADACRVHGVALIGGETAEMPGLYEGRHFDLAGTIVGRTTRRQILGRDRVRPGDQLLGLKSSGLHTNGYSLARTLFSAEIKEKSLSRYRLPDGMTLDVALLEPHRCYLLIISPLLDHPGLHAISHITGGGIVENTERVIPDGMRLELDWKAWPRPEIFKLIQQKGQVPENEMRRVFNLGIGLICIVAADSRAVIEAAIRAQGEEPLPIGVVVE